MRYEKEKKKKRKKIGKEYRVPETENYDSSIYEEMDDISAISEIQEPDSLDGFNEADESDKEFNLEDTLILDGPIGIDDPVNPEDVDGVVLKAVITDDEDEMARGDNRFREKGTEGLEYRRSRKVRKRKNYTLRILVGMLCVAGIYVLITSPLFNINDIVVENNNHYTAEQIIEMAGIEANTNMFKKRMAPIEKTLENDSYIKSANIKRKPFHKIEILLEEREEKYCILSEEKYIIADYEGIVLSIVEEEPPLTVIDNLTIKEAEIGSEIKTESNLIFSEIVSFLETVEDNDMYFKQIEASDLTVKAYLTDIFLCKGAIKNMEKDIPQIKKVIHDLSGKEIGRGTIIVSGNGSCTFNPEI